MKASRTWRRLDNAAKFFPPTSTRRDPHVFRIACELTEAVDRGCLQAALNETLRRLPYFRSTLKKGFFWYYLEESEADITVQPDTLPPCAAIYHGDNQEPLFRLAYFQRSINLEVYHALADGGGAFMFFRGLILKYLAHRHGNDMDALLEMDRVPPAARQQDDFEANYSPKNRRRGVHGERAFRLGGDKLASHCLNFIVGRMPLKAVLSAAKKHDATLSEYLVAELIDAIGREMPRRKRNRPVAVSVPVDLRRFYGSQTVRNFFANFGAVHHFNKDGGTFEDILRSVQKSFMERLQPEALDRQMNQFASLEHNLAARVMPLFIKVPVLSISGMITSGGDSAGFSNLGIVEMPQQAAQYIRAFDVMLSTTRPQLCVCSYNETLSIGFSSPFVSTEVQCAFFRALTSRGIHIDIHANTPGRWVYENL